ncbi:hypothetical protein RDV78_02440 [Bacillota bacterium LX-D]|nr:hypothetical protein [Bacillota bacterium LX-D]
MQKKEIKKQMLPVTFVSLIPAVFIGYFMGYALGCFYLISSLVGYGFGFDEGKKATKAKGI